MKKVTLKTPQDFYNFFESIPDEKWITGSYTRGRGPSCQHCAVGHLKAKTTKESFELLRSWVGRANLIEVNDGYNKKYRQKKPRIRILAFIRNFIKKLS